MHCDGYRAVQIMYALHDPEGGIFYAKPVQDNLPAYFLDWLVARRISPKELTELLYLCLEKGCDAVMTEESSHTALAQIEDGDSYRLMATMHK